MAPTKDSPFLSPCALSESFGFILFFLGCLEAGGGRGEEEDEGEEEEEEEEEGRRRGRGRRRKRRKTLFFC